MNVHHLELFYHVARHGGVSAAARRIPYGIQQPAISAQIIQLEDSLGTTLFQRRPFQLTKAGDELFRFVEPFFGALDGVGKKLRGGEEVRLRIGAPETIQREYLPRLLKTLKRRIPGLTFTLVSARLNELERRLLAQDLDFGIAAIHGKRAEGVKVRELVRVPMVLLVPAKSGFTDAGTFWKRDRIDVPLITLPGDESMSRAFQSELRRQKVEWFPSLELGSLELIGRYVTEGFGVGLSLAAPEADLAPGTRMLPLDGFAPLTIGALWAGRLDGTSAAFLEEAASVAQRFATDRRVVVAAPRRTVSSTGVSH